MRKGRGQVDNLFIISGYFLLLSRAESVCTIESKHEADIVKEIEERPERFAIASRPEARKEYDNASHAVINVQLLTRDTVIRSPHEPESLQRALLRSHHPTPTASRDTSRR